MIINYGEKEISQEFNNMSRVINKDDIILRLKNIDDFNKEYEIDEGSVKFITKKANFKHTICGTNFSMNIKDFIHGQRCPVCAAILRKEKNKKPLSDSEITKIKETGYEILEYNGYTKINIFRNIATGDTITCKISNILKNNITNISHDNKSLKPIEYYIEKQKKNIW